jgi:hypothetical protein
VSLTLAILAASAIAVLGLMAAGLNQSLAIGPLSIGLHDYLKPLIWGAAASALLLVREWGRVAWRRAAIAALATVGLLGVIAYASRTPAIVTDSDIGIGELYVELSTRLQLLVGPYSRFGWHHPGPLYFYLTAPFYAASGHRAAALYAVALAVNLAALVAIARVIAREAGAVTMTIVLAACLMFAWRVPRFMASPWTGHAAVLPSAAFLVIAAGVASGRTHWLFWLVVFGSLAAQTHLGFVPMIAGVGVTALAIAWATHAGDRRPLVRALNVSLWTALALWLLPISEAVAHQGGNLAALWRFFVSDGGPGHSLADAIANGSYGLTGVFRPDFELPWGGHFDMQAVSLTILGSVFEVALLAVTWRWHGRAGRRFEASLALVAVIATVIDIVALTRVRGDILNHDLFRIAAVGALNLGVLGAAGLRLITQRIDRWNESRLVSRTLCAAVLLAGLAVGLRDLDSLTASERRLQERSSILAASKAVQAYVTSEGIRRPLFRVGADRWGDAAGVLLRLRQNGGEAALMDESISMFSDAFAATGREDALISLADPDMHRHLRERPGNVVLLEADPLFVDAERIVPARPILRAGEVDVPAFDVRVHEPHAQPIADVGALVALREQALDVRLQDAHERAARRDARDDRVELLADPPAHRDRRDALRHRALDLARGVFLRGARRGDARQLLVRVRRRQSGEHGLDEALRHQVRVAPVRRGRVRVVLHRETEVAGFRITRPLEHVLARAHQLDHRERQIGKVIRIGRAS